MSDGFQLLCSSARAVIPLLALSLTCENICGQDKGSVPLKQSLSVDANAPKAGDVTSRYRVTYIQPGREGENVLWDFSGAEETQKAPVQYICSRDSSLLCIETDRKHRIELRNDSLLLSDTESALYSIHYDKPILLVSYPIAYTDTIHSLFHGTGTYCKTYPIEVNGTLTTTVDGYGTLCLQEGDTLYNVLRLHSIRTTSWKMSEKPDHKSTPRTSMKQEIEDRYLWFAHGHRYPLYETITNTWYHEMHQVASENMAFRSDLDDMRLLDDSVNHTIQLQDSILAAPQVEKDDLMKYTIAVSGTHATLKYTLTESATLHALLCDASGFVFQRKTASGDAGIEYEMDIDCTGLRRGVYILYLNVNGQVYSETISTKQK